MSAAPGVAQVRVQAGTAETLQFSSDPEMEGKVRHGAAMADVSGSRSSGRSSQPPSEGFAAVPGGVFLRHGVAVANRSWTDARERLARDA